MKIYAYLLFQVSFLFKITVFAFKHKNSVVRIPLISRAKSADAVWNEEDNSNDEALASSLSDDVFNQLQPMFENILAGMVKP